MRGGLRRTAQRNEEGRAFFLGRRKKGNFCQLAVNGKGRGKRYASFETFVVFFFNSHSKHLIKENNLVHTMNDPAALCKTKK